MVEPLKEIVADGPEALRAEMLASREPFVMRGLVATWPAVEAARRSPKEAAAYLAGFDRGSAVEMFVGPAAMEGRYFYRDDMSGFNFERRRARVSDLLRYLAESTAGTAEHSIYVGSTPADEVLPDFAALHPMPLLQPSIAPPRVWIGNRSVVSTHFDEADNVACVAVGRRRFTLFPPKEVSNLYVGPLDFTMAGQPASMVSLHQPDFDRHPRFHQALAEARTAELAPGDAIYIPALWWHNVEALDPFNMLVNYWWRPGPVDAGSGFEALIHSIHAISALPADQRAAWRHMFDHYAFRPGDEDPAEHIAPQHRGVLGKPTPQLRGKIRQFLHTMLSRP